MKVPHYIRLRFITTCENSVLCYEIGVPRVVGPVGVVEGKVVGLELVPGQMHRAANLVRVLGDGLQGHLTAYNDG